ncbi:MAG: ice-binding family protein, partial [Thermoanaerobaculia bacterium]
CYSSTGAMSITTGTTVTLNGPGVYIFRPGGALNTEANSIVLAANGACASDVFWAPNGASTIGANSSFVGNILEGAGAANDITVSSTASFEGRALAFGHTVTIDTDTMFVPTCGGGGPPIVAIPTLSMGPMVLFAGLLALLGFVAMRRRLAKQN